MSVVVPPEEVADVIRRTAELQHDLRTLRVRLEASSGPLAVVAVAAARTVEAEYERAAESLRVAASVLTLVTVDG